jgi:hypothetical protein
MLKLPIIYGSVFWKIRIRIKEHWTKVLYKRGRSTQEETERENTHTKESEHWLNKSSTSNRCTALQEEEREAQQQMAGPENMPKTPPIYVIDVTNISPLIQLFEQIAEQ